MSRSGGRLIAGALLSTVALAVGTMTAHAKCTRLGFSVNDYGKDGPTKDAKDLLDKYIAKWAAERGIGKYTTGKKDVTCELFLDFGVFDEHTCKAVATVCWADGPASGAGKSSASSPARSSPATAEPSAAPKVKPVEARAAPTSDKAKPKAE